MTKIWFDLSYPNPDIYRFEPNASLSDKHNYSRHYFVEPDGGIKEVVRLNVLDDRHREEIVAFHFCRQYAEIHFRDSSAQPVFNIVGRDQPWDFDYVLHDETSFSLEICRVADSQLLKAIKAENELNLLLQKDQLKAFEIAKVARLFPNLLDETLISKAARQSNKDKLFKIDEYKEQERIFMRPPMEPDINLIEAIETAIKKKARKKHSGKEKTVLLLDNIITHSDPRDFFDAAETLADFIKEVPFPSIWVYTGYYSDDDGNNCEYGLQPIKLTDFESKKLSKQRLKQRHK